MTTRWPVCAGLGLLLVCCLTSRAHADVPLRVARADEKLRVDGSLRDWRGARFVDLGRGGGSLRYALGHRDGGLYLAAEVQDDKLVRGRGVGPGQDALVLTVAMPDRHGAWVVTEVWLHPGVTGRSAAAAGLGRAGRRPRPARQIQVVEGPREAGEGYVLEAFIPWDALAESDLWAMGHAGLRYEDARRAGKARVRVESAPGRRPAELPRFAMGEGELDLVHAFLNQHGRGAAALRFDLKGDVLGDPRAERVTVADRYVIVTGPAVQNGTSYIYAELPLGSGGSVHDARLVDLTGDGKTELEVTLKQKDVLVRRVYRHEAGRLVLQAQPEPEPEPTPPQPSRSPVVSRRPVPAAPAEATGPVAPTRSEVLALAKQAAGIGDAQRPDRHLRANMLGGAQPEDLYLFGSQVILVGPGVADGAGYFAYGVPVGDSKDLREVRCADVTGDGRAELLLRVRQSVGSGGVQREVLLVQQVGPRGFARVLGVEVARWQGKERIDNKVETRAGALHITAGKARGWRAGDYPFPDEPVGGMGRLLLPWKGERVHYRFVGGRLEPR